MNEALRAPVREPFPSEPLFPRLMWSRLPHRQHQQNLRWVRRQIRESVAWGRVVSTLLFVRLAEEYARLAQGVEPFECLLSISEWLRTFWVWHQHDCIVQFSTWQEGYFASDGKTISDFEKRLGRWLRRHGCRPTQPVKELLQGSLTLPPESAVARAIEAVFEHLYRFCTQPYDASVLYPMLIRSHEPVWQIQAMLLDMCCERLTAP